MYIEARGQHHLSSVLISTLLFETSLDLELIDLISLASEL